jgi:tetratricopeptide (TPR) repeat protein
VNCIRRTLIAALLLVILSAHGASVKTGKERLRELVVMPSVDGNFTFPMGASRADFLEDYLVPAEIDKMRTQLKKSPDDPECLLKLGDLLNRANETNEARGCYEQAEKAARKISALRPQDALALTCLGKALVVLGKDDETESIFRKATAVSSNEWKCWAGLGTFLGNKAFRGLLPKDYSTQAVASLEICLSVTKDYNPSSEVLAKATAMRKESEQCFERAISLAPKDPDVYLARAGTAANFAIEDWLIHFYHERQSPDAKQLFELSCPVGLGHYLEKTARLCPDDYRVMGAAAYVELVSIKGWQQSSGGNDPSLADLPKETRVFIQDTMTHLESLSQSANKTTAAGALEYLGVLKMFFKDSPGAMDDFRRSVALEPANEKAWYVLLGAMVNSAPDSEVVDVCQSLLKCKNSAQNHVIVAKILIEQNKRDDAFRQLSQAMDLEPNNALSYLMAGALELKQSTDEETYLRAAFTELNRVNDLLGKMPGSKDRQSMSRILVLNGSILNALADKPAEAKILLKPYLDHHPDDQTAKDIMSAIE